MADNISSANNLDQKISAALDQITSSPSAILNYCVLLPDYNAKIIGIYNSIVPLGSTIGTSTGLISFETAARVWKGALDEAKVALEDSLRKDDVLAAQSQATKNVTLTSNDGTNDQGAGSVAPFDRRMQRIYQGSDGKDSVITPYDTRFASVATTGYLVSDKKVEESSVENKNDILDNLKKKRNEMSKDVFFMGVPSLINTYAMTRLYGTDGGDYLINAKGRRKWYEVDQTSNDQLGFTLTPTTTSLISWGNGDPYGRTPYHFTDFVFSKFWNRVPNNRLITLRRFAAPILDNMKFPGMDGNIATGDATTKAPSSGGTGSTATSLDTEATDNGSGKRVSFPPMATAVTYFGDETDNKLSEILKFSAGLNWGEVQANVYEVNTQSNPDVEHGPAGMFGSLTSLSKMLNVATGNFNNSAILNQGNLPPDPYANGPYENRVIGPVNRIDTVKKREAGLKFENPIEITFEYVARPIGGVNTKAVLLDILSNFLVIGTASAMFWGGQHRFMAQPQRYPFIGGNKGIQQWYSGQPLEWAKTSVTEFAGNLTSAGKGIGDFAKNFFNTLLGKGGGASGFGGIMDLLSGNNVAGNSIKAIAAEKSKDQIPYLTGLRSLLIGEPVGEWHVTIGNPLNPIAMIGNLICTKIEVEFGDELGPDDFPLDIKVKVSLDHGMPRDRDAIESIFNRGMGRIYDLSDDMTGSADFETRVDKVTGNQSKTGTQPYFAGGTNIATSGQTGGNVGKSAVSTNKLGGAVSVWNREKFASVSTTQNLDFISKDPNGNQAILNRSAFRAAEWISLKSLK
jgi:hypothetical protein